MKRGEKAQKKKQGEKEEWKAQLQSVNVPCGFYASVCKKVTVQDGEKSSYLVSGYAFHPLNPHNLKPEPQTQEPEPSRAVGPLNRHKRKRYQNQTQTGGQK